MIVRAIVLKDGTTRGVGNDAGTAGTVCACTGPGAGTVADLGGRACDVALYAALQVLSSTAGGIKALVQANSSSGYTALNTGTDLVAFTSRACRDSQWANIPWNCASATSTDRRYYRGAWSQTCGQTNYWLTAVSVGD